VRRTTDNDPWLALRREIDRSRRHGHPATLLRVPPPGSANDRRLRRELSQVTERLREALRSVDSVWAQRDGVYALLPETDRDAVESLLARLRRECTGLIPAEGLGIACFPEDGLTANALRAAVEQPALGRRTTGGAIPLAHPATTPGFERMTEADRT
jgi:hypothetical protein